MPTYMIQGSYTQDGVRALMRDGASGRRRAVEKALDSAGGKLQSMHFAFGEYDFVVIADLPDSGSAIAVATAIGSSGLARTRTTPLLTVEEEDVALQKRVNFGATGA